MNKIVICLTIVIPLIFFGCTGKQTKINQPYKINELPENLLFSISPKKKQYVPFEKVKIELSFKDEGTFEKNYNILWYKINLTPLSTINSEESYKVDWKNIHKNGYGPKNRKGVRWFLTRNWSGIIPPKEGVYKIKFIISAPPYYWKTKPINVNIHIPKEESVPYNHLMREQINFFFKKPYSVRIKNINHSMTSKCPKDRMPYEAIMKFIAEYPYSVFTKFILLQAKETERYVKAAKVDYFKDDMKNIERIIKRELKDE